MTASRRRVGVIILNWKRPQDTLTCLRSLERITDPVLDVIVVDNGSEDGSARLIREQFPGVTVIENGRNLGFAGGCNIGMRRALDHGDDYVLLLNDDAALASDTVRTLVDAADSDPRIGMVGPTIYYAGQRDVVWSAGGSVDRLGRPSHPYADGPLPQHLPALHDVDYTTGCVLLAKRAVVELIGLLDDRFFAYYEEAEWCARARRAGFRVAHVPGARAWHQVEPHARGTSPLYVYLMARNRLLYLRAIGASPRVVACAILDILRTSAAWSLRQRHRERRPFANLLRRAVADFVVGRVGPPPIQLLVSGQS